LTGLDESVLQIKTKIVVCHTPDSKPVKQEINGTVILPPLVFPGCRHYIFIMSVGQALKLTKSHPLISTLFANFVK